MPETEQGRVLRIVLDTNIAVSGLLSDGAAAAIVDLARHHPGLIRLGASENTLDELLATLRKPRLASRLERRGWTPEEIFALYVQLASPPVPTTQWQGRWSSDPDDDAFLATAYAFEADLLVTRDKDLLELKQFYQCRIELGVATFPRRVEWAASGLVDEAVSGLAECERPSSPSGPH